MKDLIVLTTFANHTEAEIVKELFSKNEIPSVIQADDVGGLGLGQTFVKGVKLLISQSDLEAAKDIMGLD